MFEGQSLFLIISFNFNPTVIDAIISVVGLEDVLCLPVILFTTLLQLLVLLFCWECCLLLRWMWERDEEEWSSVSL